MSDARKNRTDALRETMARVEIKAPARSSCHGVYGLLLAILALILYLFLRQESGYGDGPRALLDIRAGETFRHLLHFLYMPMVAGLAKVLNPSGLSLFEVAGILSALGVALGVLFLHSATCVLLGSNRSALLVAALCAVCPAVVFYATVVEFHGPFFAFSSLATLAMAWMVRVPRPRSAVLLGITTGLAWFAHASGHLLAVLLPACFLALRAERQQEGETTVPWPRQFALCGLAVLLHVLVTVGGGVLLRSFGLQVSSAGAAEFVARHGARQVVQLHLLLTTIWYEAIWPYLPLSITWWLAWTRRASGPTAVALAAAALPYLAISCLLVPGYNEHGAYLLPLTWVAALLTVRRLDSRVCSLLLLVSLPVAVMQVWFHDDPGRSRAYAAGVREIAGTKTVCLIVGHQRDYEACVITMPSTDFFDIAKLGMLDPGTIRQALPSMDAVMQETIAEGTLVLLTAGAYGCIASPELTRRFPGGTVLREHLERNYVFVPVMARGFAGWRVLPRDG